MPDSINIRKVLNVPVKRLEQNTTAAMELYKYTLCDATAAAIRLHAG